MEELHSIKTEFNELLKCGICLEQLYKPKTLLCEHTYCERCLQNLFLLNNEVVCPICREKHQSIASTHHVELLPTNLYVKQSLEILDKDHNNRLSPPVAYTVVEEEDTSGFDIKSKMSDSDDLNLKVEDIKSLSIEKEHGEEVGDQDNEEEDFFMYSDEATIPNQPIPSTKKKTKSTKFLKYLNKKMYGNHHIENEFFENDEAYYGYSEERSENEKIKSATRNDDIPVAKPTLEPLNNDLQNSGGTKPARGVNPSPFMLTMTGNSVGVLARNKPRTFIPKKYASSMQGYGYTFKKQQSLDMQKQKPIARRSQENEGQKAPFFRSPFACNQSKDCRRKQCARGKGRGVVILLK